MITLIVNDTELDFEHSLVSLSEWEAEFEKPFYPHKPDDEKTESELQKYFECMYVGPREHRHMINMLSNDDQLVLARYISKSRTATTIREIQRKPGPKENITSELIYYWMVSFQIPFKPAEEWHLNRLLMLIRVCSAKQAPPQKSAKSKRSLAQEMREANELRRKQLGTKG